ncbi:MAG: RsmD family RNA methyltransferase [Treponema sp.]|jgi:16S rRNA (guanine(966)-N(2))-methyltransferase RsmD|nr:RsmD family RNA methyltransferase [Treponema sp.]
MRITGGILRGRRVEMPQGIIRPSMDRMRESVFACLGDLSGLSFLDLFTGSGIVALEAASRGAAYIEAVEMDRLKCKTLLVNAAISPVRINCRFMTAELYLKRAKRNFNIIFLDPPFPYRYKWDLLAGIAVSPLVANESKILIHRPREDYQKEPIAFLTKYDSREYGRSVVDFFTTFKAEATEDKL